MNSSGTDHSPARDPGATTPSGVVRVACRQPAWAGGGAGLDGFPGRPARTAERAAEGGAALLVAPETPATGYQLGAVRTAGLAEPDAGGLTGGVRAIGARTGVALAYGRPELTGEDVHNRVRHVDARGAVAARHRRTHLDRAALAACRENTPYLRDRRPGSYGGTCDSVCGGAG
ncbi:nitrilase-related carbon-nitrogen hydrolase [Streptomyces sp. AC627_RSS907]|uniref:nitrilase-related carbon-nitrogen hydrolase n=1 Tax=Streptomyces sp. AC627_RSS907 TaxID=2823684 RepID=UPI001C263FF0|nr:nitrilase-related carbon-nitrogen hydrolase [Streptomyces sp. AC627_RSS907]